MSDLLWLLTFVSACLFWRTNFTYFVGTSEFFSNSQQHLAGLVNSTTIKPVTHWLCLSGKASVCLWFAWSGTEGLCVLASCSPDGLTSAFNLFNPLLSPLGAAVPSYHPASWCLFGNLQLSVSDYCGHMWAPHGLHSNKSSLLLLSVRQIWSSRLPFVKGPLFDYIHAGLFFI